MPFISITYTPSYLGAHKLCIKKQADTDYCCITLDGGDPIGVPITKTIDLSDPDLLCTISIDPCGETLDAYIYPLCQAAPIDPAPAFTIIFPAGPGCA